MTTAYTTVTLMLTEFQARLWVRSLQKLRAINAVQAKQMTQNLRVGVTLVYSDWENGRVEVQVIDGEGGET